MKENYLITVLDLPEDDWIYLDKEGIIRKILESVIFTVHHKIRGSYKKITKLTGFSKWFINKLHRKNRKKIKISHLKLLLSFLPKNKQKRFIQLLHEHITKIGSKHGILNPRLPINFASIEGAKFLGDLVTDGSLNSNFQVTYSNLNLKRVFHNLQTAHQLVVGKKIHLTPEEKKRMNNTEDLENLMKSLTGKSKVRYNFVKQIKNNKSGPNICYQLTYTNVLGKILNRQVKIPKGRRVKTNPSLPKFILTSPKLACVFISRVFSNEGHVESFGATICHSIDITRIKKNFKLKNKKELKNFLEENRQPLSPKLLWGYRKIFYLLGCKKPSEPFVTRIYFTKNEELHVKWTIYVGGEDIKTLLKCVEFEDEFKIKLENYINSVKYFKFSKHLQVSKILEIGRMIESDLGYFTSKMIANKLKLHVSTVQKHLKHAQLHRRISIAGKIGNAFLYRVN